MHFIKLKSSQRKPIIIIPTQSPPPGHHHPLVPCPTDQHSTPVLSMLTHNHTLSDQRRQINTDTEAIKLVAESLLIPNWYGTHTHKKSIAHAFLLPSTSSHTITKHDQYMHFITDHSYVWLSSCIRIWLSVKLEDNFFIIQLDKLNYNDEQRPSLMRLWAHNVEGYLNNWASFDQFDY
jgi:hypothetical protein